MDGVVFYLIDIAVIAAVVAISLRRFIVVVGCWSCFL